MYYNPFFDDVFSVFNATLIADMGTFDKEKNNLVFEVEVPGFKRDELKISTDEKKRLIVISAETKKKRKQKCLYVTRDYDLNSVSAKLDLGVLTLTIPKLVTTESKKFIEIA